VPLAHSSCGDELDFQDPPATPAVTRSQGSLTFPVGPEITYSLDTEEQRGASQGVLKPKLADKLCRSADPLSGS
jgi:hypothetical protein